MGNNDLLKIRFGDDYKPSAKNGFYVKRKDIKKSEFNKYAWFLAEDGEYTAFLKYAKIFKDIDATEWRDTDTLWPRDYIHYIHNKSESWGMLFTSELSLGKSIKWL